MNLRKHNRRALLRHRRRRYSVVFGRGPVLRFRLPLGAVVSVCRYPPHQLNRGEYEVRGARVYAPYPPDARTLRELQRWV